jgi:F-type H+-transporting ATPase subunit beta
MALREANAPERTDGKRRSEGRVVQILGGVVDVEFPNEHLPEIYEAVEVPRDNDSPLILEVQKHLGNNWVRTVAMDATDGLQRGRPAYATGAPISVPVGPETLGRVFNVLGQPVDRKGPVEAREYYPIHRPAPPFSEQSTRVEVFETGIKVIDLIAPFTKGGKTGIFGGAGVVDRYYHGADSLRSLPSTRVTRYSPGLVNVPGKVHNYTGKCSNRAL